jgi:hypothetical protein
MSDDAPYRSTGEQPAGLLWTALQSGPGRVPSLLSGAAR